MTRVSFREGREIGRSAGFIHKRVAEVYQFVQWSNKLTALVKNRVGSEDAKFAMPSTFLLTVVSNYHTPTQFCNIS